MSLRGVEARIGSELLYPGVVTNPPFSPLYETAQKVYQIPLEKLLAVSKKMDQPFLSWEFVRKFGIPLGTSRVTVSTGFEGYLVGQVTSAEELVAELAETGKHIWDVILIRYKNQWKKKKELRELILGEKFSYWAAREWSIIFEALLARKRASILTNKEALSLRSENKRKVSGLSGITYSLGESGEIKQSYSLSDPGSPIVRPTFSHLSDEQMFGLRIMQEIGKFGHPLVRTSLDSYRL